MNINVIGNIPQTLKFTQNSSVCVLQTISFIIAREKKKQNKQQKQKTGKQRKKE